MSKEPEAMTLTAQYQMLDNRARDQRGFLVAALSLMCGGLAALAVALNAGNVAGVGVSLFIMLVMAWLARNRADQIAVTLKLGNAVRAKLSNPEDVPPIDVDLPVHGAFRWIYRRPTADVFAAQKQLIEDNRSKVLLLPAPQLDGEAPPS